MNDDKLRLEFKYNLLILAIGKGYTNREFESLWTFLQFMLILPVDLESQLERKINKRYKIEKDMYSKEQMNELANRTYRIIHGVSFDDLLEKSKRERLEAERKAQQAENEKLEAAKSVLKEGMSLEKVLKIFQLSAEQISILKTSLK